MSPRSMRRASATSWSAVSRSTRPIERRYSRSESSDGSTVRSISGFFGAEAPSGPAPEAHRHARGRRTTVLRHDVHARLDQMRAELGDLLLRHLDLLEARGDLLEGQETAFASLGRKRAQLLDIHEGRLGGLLQQSDSSLMLLRQPSLLRHGVNRRGRCQMDNRVVGAAVRPRGAGRCGGKTTGRAADFGP